jgi:cytochrome b
MSEVADAGAAPELTLHAGRVRVWDPIVRIFHWTVALGVLANLTILRNRETPHIYVGYIIVAALLVRLAWGFLARGHPRFTSFVPTPRNLLGYVRLLLAGREPRYVGHNPAGAAMMVALMVLVSIVGLTGWMMGTDRYWGVGWVEHVHETSANIIIVAALLHVAGAIVESVRHKENLPWSMVTGYKRAATGSDIDHAPATD